MTNIQQANSNEPAKPQGNFVLLVVALALGVVTAGLTFFVLYQKEQEQRGNFIYAYKLRTNIEAGKNVRNRDVERVRIPRDYKVSLPTLITELDITQYTEDRSRKLTRNVKRGFWLEGIHFAGTPTDTPGLELQQGEVEIQLPASRDNPPLNITPGDFVNINAIFFLKDTGQTRSITIIEQVRAVAIDGNRNRESVDTRKKARNISIQVKKGIENRLQEIQQVAEGRAFTFTVTASGPNPRAGTINPEVNEVITRIEANKAKVRSSSSFSPSPRTGSGSSTGPVTGTIDSEDPF